MIVSAKTKYYMLRVWLCGNFSFNLLNEEPLTFVFSKNDENGLRFSGYEYNHYQSLRAKLRKMGIESNIVEFYEIYDDEK